MRGWKISRDDRTRLLERFPPVWPDVIADHVTMVASRCVAVTTPKVAVSKVVGHVNDGEGLQALVVEIDGTTDRPDGSTFHITWSIDRARGRVPKDSNEVLARIGWETLAVPIPIELHSVP